MFHLIFITAKIDHLDNLVTHACHLSLDLLALIVIGIVDVMTAGDLLEILMKPDDLMLSLSGFPVYLSVLLIVDLISHNTKTVVPDPGRCRQQF